MAEEGIAAYLNVQGVWQAVYLNVEGVAEHILTADESPFINTSLFKSNQITFKTQEVVRAYEEWSHRKGP